MQRINDNLLKNEPLPSLHLVVPSTFINLKMTQYRSVTQN